MDKLRIEIESALDDNFEYLSELFDLLACKVVVDGSGKNISLEFMENVVNEGLKQLEGHINKAFSEYLG